MFLSSVPLLMAQLSISPPAPTVRQGEPITFTANKAVVWSLTPGSAGSITPQGVYTAPLAVAVPQKAGPCQMMPPDHIFNTRIDSLPVRGDSSSLIARIPQVALSFSPSFGQNIITNATPSRNMVFLYTPDNNGSFQIPEWPDLKRESGVFTPSLAGFDRHVISVNRETCVFTDLYDNYAAGTNTLQNCPLCTGQSGVKYQSAFPLPVSGATDAAGLAQQPVSLRLSDIQSGEVRHALRFTLANGFIEPGYVWPATANAFPYCLRGTTCFKYGMHLRLKSTFNISGFSPVARIILTGLQRYGMILTDGGTTMDVQTDSSVMMNSTVRLALKEIAQAGIFASNFDVVDTRSLMLTADSGAVSLTNGYVMPPQFAEVVATANGERSTARINLLGVTVGVPEPAITVMGGHQVQLTAWVQGSVNQSVIWRIEPNVGSITPTGLYHAPSGITTPTVLRATATSAADPSAVAHVEVTVWPERDGGAIRIDVGAASDYTDPAGHTWFRDAFSVFESGTIYLADDPGVFPPGTPNYYFHAFKHYADSVYRWHLPNGNYKVTLYMSLGESTGPIPDYRAHLESQGQIAKHRLSLPAVTGGLFRRGGSVSIPMEVTGGAGYFAHRHIGEGFPVLSAIAVTPDSTPPHLEIDAPTDSFAPGRSIPLRSVGWYMPADARWQVLSGPGTIDATGVFTTPAAASGSTTLIRAYSTVDASKFATAVVHFTGNTATVCAFTMPDANAGFTVPAAGGTVSISIKSSTPGCSLDRAGIQLSGAGTGYTVGPDTVSISFLPNSASSTQMTSISIAGRTFSIVQSAAQPQSGLLFVPVVPCRLIDTRVAGGKSSRFGPPRVEARQPREVPVLTGGCGIPASAQAYSLTVTAIPQGPLSYVTLYPWGQSLPLASMLNSFRGRVTANSTVVQPGVDGSVALYSSDPADFVVDISGYFVPPQFGQGLAFYPLPPCRAVDTRRDSGKVGSFGSPALTAGISRSFDIPGSGCGAPASALAYSLNITAVPVRSLGFLTVYPTATARPLSSILNSWDGQVSASSVLVGAGAGGSISLFAPEDTDVIVDVGGYFAPPAPGGLLFYPLTPCRIADTRSTTILSAQETRTFPVAGNGCGVPATAHSLVSNVTAIPLLATGYLTVWPAGLPRPATSLLNSWKGDVVANFAVVGLGANASVTAFVTDATHLVLDALGYFSP